MIWRFSRCELDPSARTVSRDGRAVAVEPKVFDLLLYLLQNAQRYVSRDELMDRVWPDAVVGPAALSRAIKEARRAVGDDGRRQAVIATLHGRGYRLIGDARWEAEGGPAQPAAPATPREEPTVRRARTDDAADRAPRPALAWCFPEYREAVSFPVRGALVLGRSERCDVMLSGADASRRHAELRKDGPIHVVRDLGSTNGSFVNGRQVESAAVKLGDLIRLGDTLGVVAPSGADPLAHRPRALADGLIGSAALSTALAGLHAAAAGSVPVVIAGETGTGKRAAAGAVHRWSGRPGALVEVACTGLEAEDLERAHAEAATGTLVLVGLTQLPSAAQARLLQLLDTPRLAEASVRVIATTQEPLPDAVAEGRVRRELGERLAAPVTATLPPLRERVSDVPHLLAGFLAENAAPDVSAGLVELLCLYDWPFNVLELRMLARRLVAGLDGAGPLRSSHLPLHIQHPATADERGTAPIDRLLDALRDNGGAVHKASMAMGVAPEAAYALMRSPERW